MARKRPRQVARKSATSSQIEEPSNAAAAEDLMPVWFKLPRGFWRELTELCLKTGMKPEKLIHHGLKLCRKELDGQLRPRAKANEGEWINSAYWQSVTPEERQKKGRLAAMARWNKATEQSETQLPKEVGKIVEETKSRKKPTESS